MTASEADAGERLPSAEQAARHVDPEGCLPAGPANGEVISDAARPYLRFHLTCDVGPVRLRKLISHFGAIDAAATASMSELERVQGIGPKVARAIFESRTDDLVEVEIARASAAGVSIVSLGDATYPEPLRQIPDPPICLYIRGSLEPCDTVAIAVVGTRRCSLYGREQAIRFGEMLGQAGFTVVSGLARGVDGHAHRGALQVGGRTIAVLGNGLGSIYPPEHDSVAREIENAGALVSEFPIDVGPDPKNFPRRNRIIMGLSLGVIVIEAGKGSGALITARLASEYNREVFAVPGRVDRPGWTAGVNALIRDGEAKLVTSLADVLDEFADLGQIMGRNSEGASAPAQGDSASRKLETGNLSEHERAVYEAIEGGAENIDAITAEARLVTARVMPALTALQLKGLISQRPGGVFVPRTSRSTRRVD